MLQSGSWPELSIADWRDTQATLHRWTQIVGKIRTKQMPWYNHSWASTLYVTPRGLTTLAIPYGERTFQIDFDFLDHQLLIVTSEGNVKALKLLPMTVAEFRGLVVAALEEFEIDVPFHGRPNEVEDNTPFAQDVDHNSYDAAAVDSLRQALVQTDRVMQKFRAGFIGKCSPVHFFWGSFDLAVTRFSGRTAPEHPGGFPNMPDWITREAYSHEVSSCGFWPGGGDDDAIFYAYAYPTPEGFADCPVRPSTALYSQDLGEYVLPYSALRESAAPDEDLLAFFQSTYEAAAEKANWDRANLEWDGPSIAS